LLTQIKHTYPIFTTAKPGVGIIIPANVTANRKMTSSSEGTTCASQGQSCVGLVRCDGKKSE